MLLATLNDLEGAEEARREAFKWSQSASKLQGVVSYNFANSLVPEGRAISELDYDTEDELDNGSFMADWRDLDDGTVQNFRYTNLFVNKFLEWLLQDLQDDRIGWAQFYDLLQLDKLYKKYPAILDIGQENAISRTARPEQADLDQFIFYLRHIDPTPLFRIIFLPTAKDDETIDAHYLQLCEWIWHYPKGFRNVRLYWIHRLLVARHTFLDNDYNVTNLRIADSLRLLELRARLPKVLQNFTATSVPFWQSGISLNYLQKFWDSAGQEPLRVWDYVRRYEDYCLIALEGFRKHGDNGQIAQRKRDLALLNCLKIYRLNTLRSLLNLSSATEEQQQLLAKEDFTSDHGVDDQIEELRTEALQWLQDVETLYSKAEKEASWEEGLEGIKKRGALAKREGSHINIQNAVRIMLAGTHELSDREVTDLWDLIQKFKSRRLQAAIGHRQPDLPHLIASVLECDETKEMYEKMLKQQADIANAAAKDRFHLRKRLDDHRERMKEFPALRRMINMREGTPMSLEDFGELATKANISPVLIDWFLIPGIFSEEQIILMVARPGETPTLDMTSTKMSDIQRWVETYLSSSSEDGLPRIALPQAGIDFERWCAGLVAPLAKRTHENEIMVICPTEAMHRLPLHALKVGADTLIHRNPIVYTHSHSLMRACCMAQLASDFKNSLNPLFISGIGLQHSGRYSRGRASVVDLARRFNAIAMLDESATKKDFLAQCEDARLVHIHTHCLWDASNPLDHQLEFPRPASNTTDPESSIVEHEEVESLRHQRPDVSIQHERSWNDTHDPSSYTHEEQDKDKIGAQVSDNESKTSIISADIDDDRREKSADNTDPSDQYVLKAREIFSMRLQQGSHINLITCSGGLTEVQPGDEVMGLVPALLYAGASSTVSTLWPIPDGIGAKFATAFFDCFAKQQDAALFSSATASDFVISGEEVRSESVDLAIAVQHAVKHLDPDQSEPLLYWAGFVLHGYWKFGL